MTTKLLYRSNVTLALSIFNRWPFKYNVPYKSISNSKHCKILTICSFYSTKIKGLDIDLKKKDIIDRLNFQSPNDALPFNNLSIITLLHIYKVTKKDEENGYCKNRLYYISSRIQCPPATLSALLAKRSFIYSLSFEWLENSLNVLLDFNVSKDRLLRDLWVLKYHHKTIHHRLLYVKNAGIDIFYPWMVRCSEDVLHRFITIYQETKTILGDIKTTKNYLANRLNTSPEYIDEVYIKVPTLKNIRVTKVKKFLDFLINEGFEIEDIANKPRVLSASQNTVKQRIEKLRSLGVHQINLNILCRCKKDFDKHCDSIANISKSLKLVKNNDCNNY